MVNLESFLFSPKDKPFGLAFDDWTAKWWEWILQIPKRINPLLDLNGKNANLNVFHHNVFFLCQTLESSQIKPSRTIKIPLGSSIFMPIINWVSILHEDGENDEQLLLKAKERMDVVQDLELCVNEIILTVDQLRGYRIRSPFIDIVLPENNILDIPPGVTRMISEGFWIFLQPLQRNTSIKTFGSCSSGATRISVDYSITVY